MKLAYVDSSVWITRVEGLPKYRQILTQTITQLLSDDWQLCVSDAVLLEVLTKPYKQNNLELIILYRKIFDHARMLKTPSDIFAKALLLIQSEKLNAMDAVHVSLALHHHCQSFISTDKHFSQLKSISTIWIDLKI